MNAKTSPSKRNSPAEPAQADVEADLNGWLDTQFDWYGAWLGQVGQSQQVMLSTWMGLMQELARQWQAPADAWMRWATGQNDSPALGLAQFWTTLPANFVRPVAPPLDASWSPWTPFLVRGSEQLA